ncbi:Nn.00g069170.m01.CDS01 [Neocucurbitaria sp. VM-36]
MFRTPLGSKTLKETYTSVYPGEKRLLPPARTTTSKQEPFEKQLTTYLLQHQHTSRNPNHNMSFLLPGLRRGLLLSTPIILSTPLLVHQFRHRQQIRCDGPDPLTKITNDLTRNYASEAQTPIITQSGAANPRAVRQISMGSILGVIGGLGISVFSKPLAVLIGLGIFVLQFVESRGIHIIPYSYLQRRFKSTNVRSLVRDNVAFKLSFGLTFALAAFAEF